jgi:hypothetical protein
MDQAVDALYRTKLPLPENISMGNLRACITNIVTVRSNHFVSTDSRGDTCFIDLLIIAIPCGVKLGFKLSAPFEVCNVVLLEIGDRPIIVGFVKGLDSICLFLIYVI